VKIKKCICTSEKNRGARKIEEREKRALKINERERKSAKFKAKKERESPSAKSFPRKRKREA
jgi:hypothetical protein